MTEQKNQAFNTDFKYAIVAGWLIIPAIHVLFTMFGSILIVFLGQPQNLEGAGLVTYIFSLVMILYHLKSENTPSSRNEKGIAQ